MTAPQFKFRLQRLLDLRQLAEREAAIALATAQNIETEARREKDSVIALRAATREHLLPPAGSQCRVAELRQISMLLERLDAGKAQAEYKVSKAENQVHQKQVLLGETVTNRRVLDRLKERQRETWRIADDRAQRAVMDDIGRARFADKLDHTQTTED
jgi:flagellar export protein FliJ